MSTAAWFTIAKKCKQPMCPSTDGWINKMWYIPHNGILFVHIKEWSTDTRYNVEGIVLSERAIYKTTNTVWCHFYAVPRVVKSTEIGRRMVVTRGWGGGMGSYCLMGTEFEFCKKKRVVVVWCECTYLRSTGHWKMAKMVNLTLRVLYHNLKRCCFEEQPDFMSLIAGCDEKWPALDTK